jgi:hypothetical protein
MVGGTTGGSKVYLDRCTGVGLLTWFAKWERHLDPAAYVDFVAEVMFLGDEIAGRILDATPDGESLEAALEILRDREKSHSGDNFS